jgi:DNA-binding transcriptional LysR family regulator
MRFSLEQLEAFVAAVEEQSFSAAARKLKKSQAAVSTALTNLEVDLGTTLFDRSHRYPALTPEGRALLSDAMAILAHSKELQEKANGMYQGIEPKLVIAIDEAIAYEAIAGTFRLFEKHFPDLQLHFLRPSQTEIIESVSKGVSALGLVPYQASYPQGVVFRRIGNLSLVIVVRHDHALAGKRNVSLAELHDYRQILTALPPGESLISPRCWFVESYAAMLAMANDSLGWAILPKHFAKNALDSGQLVELHLSTFPVPTWNIGIDLVWSTETKHGKATAWMKAELSRCTLDV